LLDEFENLFSGKPYLHRKSTSGDFVAMHLFEDLHAVAKSRILRARIEEHSRVLNTQNRRHGISARRGDGTFGELIPNVEPIVDPGYATARGPIATVEIGCEVKILAKAMIKQIDRVIGDLVKQVGQFRVGAGNPICLGVVGVNHAESYISYEGRNTWPTDGSSHYRHPIQEAADAHARLLRSASPAFDEFLVLPFRATNAEPYEFEWVDLKATELDYGAILTRMSREYDRRFRNGNGGDH
jgi:hypothetical protein